MRLPQLINDSDEIKLSPKTDDDQQMGMMDDGKNDVAMKGKGAKAANKMMRQQIQADINWNIFLKQFEKTNKERLITEIGKTILQVPSAVTEKMLMQHVDTSSRDNFIKSVTIQLMATPEYQLC